MSLELHKDITLKQKAIVLTKKHTDRKVGHKFDISKVITGRMTSIPPVLI